MNRRGIAKNTSLVVVSALAGALLSTQVQPYLPKLNVATAQVTGGSYSGGSYSGGSVGGVSSGGVTGGTVSGGNVSSGGVTAVMPSGGLPPTVTNTVPGTIDGRTATQIYDENAAAIGRAIGSNGADPALDPAVADYVARAISEFGHQRLEDLLKDERVPKLKPNDVTATRIEGPEIPASTVTPFTDLVSTDPASPEVPGGSANSSLPSWWSAERIRSSVIFRKTQLTASSSQTMGNGVLIDEQTILTARHVAKAVEGNPKGIRAFAIGNAINNLITPMEFVRVVYLDATADPDLALVKVKPLKDEKARTYPQFGKTTPASKGVVYAVGAAELEELPKLFSGIVTTSSGSHAIDDKGVLKLTSFGTSLRCFPSVSGSPVFDHASGDLVGIVVAGQKAYVPTGEAVVRIKEGSTKWENITLWTWAAPVPTFGPQIREKAKL